MAFPDPYSPAPKLIGRDAYTYTPLPPSTPTSHYIRTLRLLPASTSEPISCLLQTTRLHPSGPTHPYQALSYCWGPPTSTAIIHCSGQKLRITQSLHTALVAVRDQDTPRTLWADAVCINQLDTGERSAQVAIMARIYDQAVRVLVWLGPAAGESRLAFRLAGRMAREWNRSAGVGVVGDLETPIERLRAKYGLPRGSRDPEYKALAALLRRPWFRRVWVVQEVVAARAATLMCGADEMAWDDFAGGIYWGSGAPVLDSLPASVTEHLSFMLQLRQRGEGNAFSLPFLLRFLSPCEATDPRDKIFALYAMKMLPRMSALARDLAKVDIAPDYSLSHEALYIRCFHDIIRTTGSLDILYSLGMNPDPTPKLPSWVPDISRPRFSDEIAGDMMLLCAAGSSLVKDCRLDTDGTSLLLRGFVADSIIELGEMCPRPLSLSEVPATILGLFGHAWAAMKNHLAILHALADWDQRALRSTYGTRNPTAESREDIYWQILQARNKKDTQRDNMGQPCDEVVMRQGYAAFYRRRLCSRAGFAVGQHSTFLKQGLLYLIYKHWEWSGSIFRSLLIFALWPSLAEIVFALFVLLQVTWNSIVGFDGTESLFILRMNSLDRRLARTELGYMAIVPAGSRFGDGVTIFMGSRTPVVVRRQDEGWRMVGMCYVHGMMKGELWHENKCDEMKIV